MNVTSTMYSTWALTCVKSTLSLSSTNMIISWLYHGRDTVTTRPYHGCTTVVTRPYYGGTTVVTRPYYGCTTVTTRPYYGGTTVVTRSQHGHIMVVPRSQHGHIMVVPRSWHGHNTAILWLYHGRDTVILWLYHGHNTAILWWYHGRDTAILWLYHGHNTAISWWYHGRDTVTTRPYYGCTTVVTRSQHGHIMTSRQVLTDSVTSPRHGPCKQGERRVIYRDAITATYNIHGYLINTKVLPHLVLLPPPACYGEMRYCFLCICGSYVSLYSFQQANPKTVGMARISKYTVYIYAIATTTQYCDIYIQNIYVYCSVWIAIIINMCRSHKSTKFCLDMAVSCFMLKKYRHGCFMFYLISNSSPIVAYDWFPICYVNPDGCHMWDRQCSLFPKYMSSLPCLQFNYFACLD